MTLSLGKKHFTFAMPVKGRKTLTKPVPVFSPVSMWDWWWRKWQQDSFSSQHFGFLLFVSSHKCSILIHSSITNAPWSQQLSASLSYTLNFFLYSQWTSIQCKTSPHVFWCLSRPKQKQHSCNIPPSLSPKMKLRSSNSIFSCNRIFTHPFSHALCSNEKESQTGLWDKQNLCKLLSVQQQKNIFRGLY